MDFDFGTSEPQKENDNNENETSQPPQQNNEGFLNMDFLTNPSESQPKSTLDDMLNMNFKTNEENQTIPQSNNFQNMEMNINQKIDEEEQKRIEAREKEA